MTTLEASSSLPSIRIWHENLSVLSGGDESQPLASLSPDDHIHGGLRIEIRGRLVPSLGFFGPDDVCFNTWLEELTGLTQKLLYAGEIDHVFDEGEQGQPAFVFKRRGESVFFSISESQFSEGIADPEWQEVEFGVSDFLRAYQELVSSFLSTLKYECPGVAENWLTKRLMAVATPNDVPVVLSSEIWRDGGSLSATVTDRGSILSFWLSTNRWDHPKDADHEHLFVSKGSDPRLRQKKIKTASPQERRWLVFLRRAKLDLLEHTHADNFKRLLGVLHNRCR